MIVPRTRLMVWFALLVLPLTLLAAVVPAAGRGGGCWGLRALRWWL